MREEQGDIWEKHAEGYWIVIPTNGERNSRGENVMGAGVALQAKQKFPKLAKEVGHFLEDDGNLLFMLTDYRLLTFPTKNKWRDKSDLELIGLSAFDLAEFADLFKEKDIYLPRVGCGLGGLDWEWAVKPVLEKHLDDRFIVLKWPGTDDPDGGTYGD